MTLLEVLYIRDRLARILEWEDFQLDKHDLIKQIRALGETIDKSIEAEKK